MPILLLFDAAPEFVLSAAGLEAAVGSKGSVKELSGGGIRKLEIVSDGLSFFISYHGAEKTASRLYNCDLSHVFTEQPAYGLSAIGIAYGNHIIGGKHTKAINQAILRLARNLGEYFSASTIIWLPAPVHCEFTFFKQITSQYEDGGPFPVLAQIAISESFNNILITSGLIYFAGQEIKLNTSKGYDPNAAMKTLVRIAHDIASNGKIDNFLITEGLTSGEIITFSPLENQNIVEITISEEEQKPPR